MKSKGKGKVKLPSKKAGKGFNAKKYKRTHAQVFGMKEDMGKI